MKFLHTADLHIGKVVNDFSMLEDQRFILEQIKGIAIEQKVDAVLLAGDIYDRAIPTGEAVLLLDSFLTELSKAGIWIFMVSGNHDSAERLSFAGKMLAEQKIGIGSVYKDKLTAFVLEKDDEKVEVVLLPFIKPSQVDAKSSGEAVEKVLKDYLKEKTADDANMRRILITHYFVTDGGKEPELSDSETTIHVGGLDNVEATCMEGFDYVALGHIHKTQQISDRPMYYAGSPLKYSFGEVNSGKYVLCIEMCGKNPVHVKKLPLLPMREMRRVKGSLQEVLSKASLEGAERNDYIQVVLTDTEELIDPIGTLRSVYPNIMQIVREEKVTENGKQTGGMIVGKKDPLSLFEEFYELVREEKLTEEERTIMKDVLKRVN